MPRCWQSRCLGQRSGPAMTVLFLLWDYHMGLSSGFAEVMKNAELHERHWCGKAEGVRSAAACHAELVLL